MNLIRVQGSNEVTLYIEEGQLTAALLEEAIEAARQQISVWNIFAVMSPELSHSPLFDGWQVAGTTQDNSNRYRTLLKLQIRRSNDGRIAAFRSQATPTERATT